MMDLYETLESPTSMSSPSWNSCRIASTSLPLFKVRVTSQFSENPHSDSRFLPTVEVHPYLPQKRLVEWVQAQGIHITAYSSFGPGSYVTLNETGKTAKPLLEHDLVKTVAQKHNKTAGQILLRWAIERDIAVIPKSAHAERMKSNLDVFSWSLDEQDRNQLDSLSQGLRFNGMLCKLDYSLHLILTIIFFVDPDSYGFNLPLFA